MQSPPPRYVCTTAFSPEEVSAAITLARSLILIGDMTPRAVITNQKNDSITRYFDKIVFKELEAKSPVFPPANIACIMLPAYSLVFKRLAPCFDEMEQEGRELRLLANETSADEQMFDLEFDILRARYRYRPAPNADYVAPHVYCLDDDGKAQRYTQAKHKLEGLEAFCDRIDTHYRPPFHSLKRSLQKRFMKMFWGIE